MERSTDTYFVEIALDGFLFKSGAKKRDTVFGNVFENFHTLVLKKMVQFPFPKGAEDQKSIKPIFGY